MTYNLIEKAENDLKTLFDSNLTTYEISKKTGTTVSMVDRYRNGESSIENMTLKTSKKLLELKKSIEEQRESDVL